MISRPKAISGVAVTPNSSTIAVSKSNASTDHIHVEEVHMKNDSTDTLMISPNLSLNSFRNDGSTETLTTTPKNTTTTSSQGSQGLRRSVGLLNLSLESTPNPEMASSPKCVPKRRVTRDNQVSDYIDDVENWSPFKEPSTPTLSKKPISLKRQASNSGNMSPFINDSQKPLLLGVSNNTRTQRTIFNAKFNKLRKMVSLDKMSYTNDSPFDNELHPLPNPSIHVEKSCTHEVGSPNESPSKPARQKQKVDKGSTDNKIVLHNKFLKNVNNDPDFLTPESYKFVKPLQTAFMSSGLLSKKNRKVNESIVPPETPCKKPIQMNVSQKTKNPVPSSNLSNVICAVTSSPMINSTPKFKDEEQFNSNSNNENEDSPSMNNVLTSSVPRSARDLNANDLRDCILQFTNDFEEGSDSIFDNEGDLGIDNHPPTPTRLKKARDVAVSKALKLNVNYFPPLTPSNNKGQPKTPIDASIDTSDGSFNSTSFSGISMTKKDSADEHLSSKFENVQMIGDGEFSNVYEITFQAAKYAVKRIKTPFLGSKRRKRILEEVEMMKILQENEPEDDEGKEYVANLINDWEFNGHLYIMMEFCENGSLEKYLMENGTISKLDEWRIWKIVVEISLGLKYIHSCNILHLDLKPANIFITFEGSLKIGDFGMATKYPVPIGFEREGDREYIAPEIINHQQYEKPADIFSFGLIMVEIAANIILPDNGIPWQKLRSGDLSDAGRLSSTELNVNLYNDSIASKNSTCSSILNITGATGSSYSSVDDLNGRKVAPWTPKFLIDGKCSLDKLVEWMINPKPENRPTAADILNSIEAQFVEIRRKAGAVIFEGEFGPPPDSEEESLMSNEVKSLNFSSTQNNVALTIPSDIMDENEW